MCGAQCTCCKIHWGTGSSCAQCLCLPFGCLIRMLCNLCLTSHFQHWDYTVEYSIMIFENLAFIRVGVCVSSMLKQLFLQKMLHWQFLVHPRRPHPRQANGTYFLGGCLSCWCSLNYAITKTQRTDCFGTDLPKMYKEIGKRSCETTFSCGHRATVCMWN